MAITTNGDSFRYFFFVCFKLITRAHHSKPTHPVSHLQLSNYNKHPQHSLTTKRTFELDIFPSIFTLVFVDDFWEISALFLSANLHGIRPAFKVDVVMIFIMRVVVAAKGQSCEFFPTPRPLCTTICCRIRLFSKNDNVKWKQENN